MHEHKYGSQFVALSQVTRHFVYQHNHFQLIYSTAQMDSLGFRPLLDYLTMVNLPECPSLLKNETNGKNATFDWVKTIATIKSVFGADVIFGFDIFPDPTNRSMNRLVLGTPESSSVLPL